MAGRVRLRGIETQYGKTFIYIYMTFYEPVYIFRSMLYRASANDRVRHKDATLSLS